MAIFSPGQVIQNQGIGTVIGALIKFTSKLNDNYISDPGQFQTQLYQYQGYPVPMTARMQESYQFEAEVTQNAIETGAPITDHVILRPVRIDLSFEVGNADGVGEDALLAAKALDEAIRIWKRRKYFDLVTTHRYLKDMVCISLRPENQAPEWGALRFRATFQQVSFATLKTAKYDPDNVRGGAQDQVGPGSDAAQAAGQSGGPANGGSATSAADPQHVTPLQKELKNELFSKTHMLQSHYTWSPPNL